VIVFLPIDAEDGNLMSEEKPVDLSQIIERESGVFHGQC
jgi:hypothetical protein